MFPLVLCQNNKRVCHLKTLSNHKNKLWWPPQPWLIIPWQKWWWVAYVTCRKFSKSVILRDQVICGWRSLLTGEQEERGRERESTSSGELVMCGSRSYHQWRSWMLEQPLNRKTVTRLAGSTVIWTVPSLFLFCPAF